MSSSVLSDSLSSFLLLFDGLSYLIMFLWCALSFCCGLWSGQAHSWMCVARLAAHHDDSTVTSPDYFLWCIIVNITCVVLALWCFFSWCCMTILAMTIFGLLKTPEMMCHRYSLSEGSVPAGHWGWWWRAHTTWPLHWAGWDLPPWWRGCWVERNRQVLTHVTWSCDITSTSQIWIHAAFTA